MKNLTISNALAYANKCYMEKVYDRSNKTIKE